MMDDIDEQHVDTPQDKSILIHYRTSNDIAGSYTKTTCDPFELDAIIRKFPRVTFRVTKKFKELGFFKGPNGAEEVWRFIGFDCEILKDLLDKYPNIEQM